MTGHLSRADVQAKDVGSLVLESADLESVLDWGSHGISFTLTDFRVELHLGLCL